MDSNNILTPTDNIEELDRDYLEWLNLPMKHKLISNSECNSKYHCDIDVLYHKMKNNILAGKSNMNLQGDKPVSDNSSNIVFEAAANNTALFLQNTVIRDTKDPKYEEYADKLAKSAEYQQSPYIVIIDPEDSRDTVISKYNTYLLSGDNRDNSNYYSWNIWGYNVDNMYAIMMNHYDNEDKNIDSNNSNLAYTNENSNYISCIAQCYDFYNKAFIEGDILSIARFKQNYKVDSITESAANEIVGSQYRFLEENYKLPATILPAMVPWLTGSEMNRFATECTVSEDNIHHKYLKTIDALQEEYYIDKDKSKFQDIINMGWNPSVKASESSLKDAIIRHLREANNMRYYDISIIKESEVSDLNATPRSSLNVVPVYFLFFLNGNIGVAFPEQYKLGTKLDPIYVLEFNPEGYLDKVVYRNREELGNVPVKLTCVFVDRDSYNDIYNKFTNSDCLSAENMDKFRSIYPILMKARNTYNPHKSKILYQYAIDILLKAILIDKEDKDSYIASNIKTMFLIYKGLLSEYDKSISDKIMNIICDEENIEKYLTSTGIEPERDLVNKIRASATIYNTAD